MVGLETLSMARVCRGERMKHVVVMTSLGHWAVSMSCVMLVDEVCFGYQFEGGWGWRWVEAVTRLVG